ncbi:hypothetical protein GZ77_14610 [Endozoicomonas montiporae]|uniref:Uncharacterized protein n=2 Tax=Endozoicomonas montiporae TaxID=1027273 RepID=A0A081N533_9GAMM|nr:hypothetical protein [Endozoicomonas montiporae]AMO57567.1 hypothetical protein EZMO1_3587 [Endozoicomonas montiporae CL-33]KEQ13556.1 hypothetical protein GZ77_14610 [Endozoicomonas montiporae]
MARINKTETNHSLFLYIWGILFLGFTTCLFFLLSSYNDYSRIVDLTIEEQLAALFLPASTAQYSQQALEHQMTSLSQHPFIKEVRLIATDGQLLTSTRHETSKEALP